MSRGLLCGASLWLLGCGSEPTDPARVQAPQVEAEAQVEGRDAEEGGWIALDTSPTGRLLGLPHEAPPNADPDRVVTLRVEPATLAPGLDGASVLDARFVDGAVAVITPDHHLEVHRGAEVSVVDEAVHGPIGVRGAALVYTIGDPPFLEVARADVRTGERAQVSHDLAPTWNPALGPDGEIYVVSGATGGPRLLRLGDGEPEVIETERFPSSVRASRVEGGDLIFEDEAGDEVRLAIGGGR